MDWHATNPRHVVRHTLGVHEAGVPVRERPRQPYDRDVRVPFLGLTLHYTEVGRESYWVNIRSNH